MKKLLLLSPLLCAFAIIGIQQWKLGEGYEVKFTSPDITGTFKSMKADIRFSEQDPEHSSFDVKVQVASLETGNPGMNDAAKATDMLDAAKFPEIHFLSTQVTRNLSGYHALGKLEMHGIQKEIDIPFSFRDHTFKGMFTVACSAYGMKGAGKGASDSVTINLTVPVKE